MHTNWLWVSLLVGLIRSNRNCTQFLYTLTENTFPTPWITLFYTAAPPDTGAISSLQPFLPILVSSDSSSQSQETTWWYILSSSWHSLAVSEVPGKQHTLQKPRKSYANLDLLLFFKKRWTQNSFPEQKRIFALHHHVQGETPHLL